MDLGAERAVLAGIFSYGLESYVEVCDIIDSDSFSHKNNQVIFKCIEKIIKDGAEIDLPSLLSAAKKLDLQDIINSNQELEYINSLMEYPVKKDNVLYFAAQIKKFEFARKIKKLTNKIGRDIDDINGDESIDEIINILENPITDFLREDDTGNKPERIGDGVEEYLEFLIENKCDQIGIPTGFARYDAAIGGV